MGASIQSRHRNISSTRGVQSRVNKQNEELRMLCLVQRSKHINQNLYKQPVGGIDLIDQRKIHGGMLPLIESLHDSTVSSPYQEAHLKWVDDPSG